MNITRVQVHVNAPDNKVKAFADIIIDDEFIVKGLAVREDREGCAFVTMPFRIKNEQRMDIAYPIREPCRKYIEDRVIDEYERVLNIIANSKRPPVVQEGSVLKPLANPLRLPLWGYQGVTNEHLHPYQNPDQENRDRKSVV